MANRSLGTLTVDVVAQEGGLVQGMDRAQRAAERAQSGIERSAKRHAKATEQAWSQATNNVEKQFGGMSEAQYKNNMRMVPAQITDIVVGLQGGQKPLTVLLQQGGQLRDMFGSVGGAFSALGKGILGLINPFSVLAAGAGALAFGFLQGRKESQEFLIALETTGNRAGSSVSQLNDMASAMDALDGVTRGKAAAALALFATSAGVGADRLEQYTATALAWEQATGQAAEEVAKNFKKIADDPVKGIIELDKQMAFLTSGIYAQVKALQDAGKETDAARVAQDAYDSAVATAAKNITGNLGYVERAMKAITGATGEMIDAIRNVGRQAGMGTQLAENATKMAELQSKGVKLVNEINAATTYPERQLYQLKQQEIQLQKNLVAETNTTRAKAAARADDETRIGLSQEADKYADKATKKRRELAAAEEKYGQISKTNAEAAKQYAAVQAGIEEKYKEKPGRKPAKSQGERDVESADRYIARLAAAADGRKQLTAYEQLAYDLEVGKVKMTERQKSLAQGQATAIDMAKEAESLRGDAILRNNALYEAQERILSKASEYQLALSTYGMGDKEAAQMRERIGLMQKQQEELRKLEQDQANALTGAKDSDEMDRLKTRFAERLEIVKGAQAEELRLYEDFTAAKSQADQNWQAGIESATKTYLERTQDSYSLARDATTSLMSTVEGAFTSMFTRGETSFKGFLSTILQGIAQIAAQQAASGIAGILGQLVSGAFGATTGSAGLSYEAGGSFSFGGGRASGGPVGSNTLYRVNENGPEMLTVGGKDYLMTGGQSGYVTPNAANLGKDASRSSGAVTIVNQTTGRIDSVEERRINAEDRVLIIKEAIDAVNGNLQNANSSTSRTMARSFNVGRRR